MLCVAFIFPAVMDSQSPSPAEPLKLASARRRVIACGIDLLILMLIGQALGRGMPELLIALGPWGRLFGLAVAAAYFGVLDSRAVRGATVGKLTLGLRVVDAAGGRISSIRATLRFLPLGLVYFLRDAPLPVADGREVWAVTLQIATCGLGGAGLYLLLFNRASRQSVHDLLAGTYVVGLDGPAPRPVWRGHLLVCALIVIASGVAALRFPSLGTARTPPSLAMIQQALVDQPWVAYAVVRDEEPRYFGIGPLAGIRVVAVTVGVQGGSIEQPERFAQAARTVLALLDDPDQVDAIAVSLQRGYDIGISSRHWSSTQTHSVAEWRLLVGPAGEPI